ncbi:translocation/assembly module TamB domain-containing protein [Christiangramia crocea]|uniref:Translocation/assembly module TamB domain-containing protein n=1 Tax=Christiangramia crocea TaxID=2904124 RepID=A0A9X2A8G7_9FLAO|nr:translocation/assembly module TamB [Gramella crocea]MCG9972407.1 translocation/assembly module TamB domain-containing protein [Gramella crocea]
MAKSRKQVFKILKLLGKIFLGLFVFLLIVILFVRSPWGQNIIKDQFINSIEKKSGVEINLERIFIEFNGDIQIDGLHIEDSAGDTIIFSESLSANIGLWPLIKGDGFSLNDLDATNLKANIIRKDSVSGFNYEVLMKAFAGDSTQTAPADSTSKPMDIKIGELDLKDFDIDYRDGVSGIDSKFKFEHLKLNLKQTNLQNMVYRAEEVNLDNAEIYYNQTKAFPESDEEPAADPVISIEDLSLSDVKLFYKSVPDSLLTDVYIDELQLAGSGIDLKEQEISGKSIQLSNSVVVLKMLEKASVSDQPASPSGFVWPEWKINVANVDFQNNNFFYSLNNAGVKDGVFDPNAIKLDSLYLMAEDLNYEKEKATANIQKLEFKEGSGIDVNRFNISAVVSNEKMEFRNLNLAANNNSIAGEVIINYSSFDEFLEQPGTGNLQANFSDFILNTGDIFRFQPDLRNNEYIQSLATERVRGSLAASGKLNNLKLTSFNLRWKNTSLSGTGTVDNLQDPDNLYFSLPNANLSTVRGDLVMFIKEEDLGIKLPERINLSGSFAGSPSKIETNSVLKTSEGSLDIDGNFEVGEEIVFDAEIMGDSIALGKLLQNEALGDLQLELDVSGGGNSMNDLDANLESIISSFTYKDYEFRGIEINGKLENGQGPVNLFYQDANLEMEAQTQVALDSVSPRIDLTLYLDGANLGALGITQKSIKTGFVLEGWFEGDANKYEAQAEIIDGVAVYNNNTYLLGSFEASAYVRPDSTSVQVDNRVIDLDLQSNADPVAFTAAINRHFKRYITENYSEDSITRPVNLKLDAKINQAPILNEVFLVNLEELDSVDIQVDFREKDRQLDASISIPFINYYSSAIDSLTLNMQSDPDDLNFEFAFNELNAGPLAIKRTIIDGKVLDRKLNLDFRSIYEQDSLVHVNSELNFQGDTLKFHINPQNLILNRNPWNIAASNQISYAKEYLQFKDFKLYRNEQEMQIGNNEPGVEKEHISLAFSNFKLAPLLNYLNPENQLAKGQLNGSFIYEEPFGKTGILADMQINQFGVMDVDLNTLSLKGNSTGFSNYDFEMALKGGEIDLDLTGSYVADETSARIDMNLDLNEVRMTALEGFSLGEIKNGSGSFSGNFTLNGTFAEPQYEGSLKFNNAGFNVAFLNAPFILPDEELRLDNQAVYFDDFNINDNNQNSFVMNGKIITENFLNPGFDLDLQAQDFRLLNSTEEDNDLFYGDAVVDVDAQVTGDLNLPVINMDLDVKESTNFTYVVPETELQMKERDGIVIFVNKEDPDDILTQTEEESYVVSGYDIYSRINIDEGATFNMIINQETGDKFQVQGEGDLIFNMYPNGRLALTGIYEINDGYYEMSLYNLVKRRFDIADGSRVSWAGDPFEAQLDVRAVYSVETSASSLMASRLSATDPSTTQRYRQELPFYVYLNIDGELMEPEITFSLDMPEEEQGAIGGQVYGVVQQLNNQEQELNKQVFSLLVLNRFFPGSGSDGSSGGTLAVARDNLNDALSDQLNMLSSRILGESGLQLNFQVDSFTDYQGESPQDRTQLDISAQKAFLEDRLIVEVGSELDIQGGNQPGQETSPVIGNVSISYLLDEEGVWRIKGFSRSQYENVIDGQLIVSGIALIFTKEFNKFKNMFERAVMEKVKKEEEIKAENKEEGTDEN